MRAVKNLLVLYTGGTIGMLQTPHGLAPAGGFEARMRAWLDTHPTPPRVHWRLQEMSPLLDSANMQQANWLAMQAAIVTAVTLDGHDGILLLHGTDTLAYSAAALSFQLLGLTVPVLFTGSMLPAGTPDSDAWENLTGALQVLSQGTSPGVQLYFHGQLLAPNRTAKVRSFGRNPFATLQRSGGAAQAPVPAALACRAPLQVAKVAVLPLVPGLDAALLQATLDSGVQGLVLECYGSGTGPCDDDAFVAVLEQARARDIVVVAITQCHEGGVELEVYAAGSRLREAGVLSGGGMTREAAFGKLQALLGSQLPVDEVRRLVGLDLAGELR